MVINLVSHLKIPLINPGRNHRLILDLYTGDRFSILCKRLLDPDIIIRAIRFAAKSQHISAQIDQRMGYILLFQIFLQLIRNISLCNSAKINSRLRIQKLNRISINLHILISDMTFRFLNRRIIRNGPRIILEIPQVTERGDCNIKLSFCQAAVFHAFLNEIHRIIRKRYRLPVCMVQFIDLAPFRSSAKPCIIILALRHTSIQHIFRILIINRNRHHRIKHGNRPRHRLCRTPRTSAQTKNPKQTQINPNPQTSYFHRKPPTIKTLIT